MPGKLCFQSRSLLLSHHQTPAQGRKWWRNMPPISARLLTSDYLRRKEDTSSRWRPSLSSQRSHVKKVVSCWDKNRMTVIRSDSWDHWLVTESLFTLSSTIKSSLSDAMPFTYFLPIFQTAYCLCFISGHTWLLALNSFLTWLNSMVEKLRSSLSPVCCDRGHNLIFYNGKLTFWHRTLSLGSKNPQSSLTNPSNLQNAKPAAAEL